MAQDVAVDMAAGLAYVASVEFGLSVVDISHPEAPVALGGAVPSFSGSRVAASGSLAVLTLGTNGLRVVDVVNPSTPQTVGSLPGTMGAVAISGTYAYVLQTIPGNPAHVDLIVVDLATPSTPSIVGRLTFTSAAGLKVVGSRVYVAAGSLGLQVVDVSNPANPVLAGGYDTPGSAKAVAIVADYAYVADYTSLQVLELGTHPDSPTFVGSLGMSTATAIAASNNRVYLIDNTSFKMVDVQNPASPVLMNGPVGTSTYGALNLEAADNFCFLATSNHDTAGDPLGLYVLDVSPSVPQLVGSASSGFDSYGVAVSGSVAVAGGGSLGLKVVDVSSPMTPQPVGFLSGNFAGAVMIGQYAYVLNTIPGNPAHVDLVVVDLTTPAAPAIVGRLSFAGAAGIATDGSLVYVAGSSGGLYVVDVSDPILPQVIGAYDTPASAKAVSISNGYAYVADYFSLQIIEIGDHPTTPTFKGSLAMSTATAIAVAGDRAYLLDGLSLKVVNVSDPTAPSLLTTSTNYTGQSLAVVGNLLFLSIPSPNFTPKGTINILNLPPTGAPGLLSTLTIPGISRALAVSGNYVYAGDSAGVIDVISLVP